MPVAGWLVNWNIAQNRTSAMLHDRVSQVMKRSRSNLPTSQLYPAFAPISDSIDKMFSAGMRCAPSSIARPSRIGFRT
ncbi:MAG: hypothetical protein BWY66_02642 [bacterium ADurb.Bin374]|nr:MAG: hypothetical protein BWY66_02642 [bacterium ADurb.Bin374]